MKMEHVLGTVTIVAIIGGTVYAIKKSRDAKKAEENEISFEEAAAIVKEKEMYESVHFVTEIEELSEEEMDEVIDDAREMAEHNRSYMPYNDVEETEEDTLDYEEAEESDDYTIGTFTEEDRVLRYEPSSIDALKQYKRMELVDIEGNNEVYQTMLRLFDFPFEPVNDGDEMLRTQIIDYRVQFFGFGSKWVQQITFADVILHYARIAQFNADESVGYWVEYFLSFNDLYYTYSNASIDALINTLNAHQYFNDERQTFGLFGLSRESMDQAIRIANMNIDRSVTYEIEFQEFLKSCF